jgi:hypothetical protein
MAARKDHQLQMELEKQRLTVDLLRRQLTEEITADVDETSKSTDQVPFSLWDNYPPVPQIPGGPATTSRSPFGKNGPAWPQQRSNTPFPPLNVNMPQFAPNTSYSQAQSRQGVFGSVSQTFPPTPPQVPTGERKILQPFSFRQNVIPQQPAVYVPDAWIFTVDRHDSPPTSRPSSRPPKAEPPKFDGNPRNWPMFIQS